MEAPWYGDWYWLRTRLERYFTWKEIGNSIRIFPSTPQTTLRDMNARWVYPTGLSPAATQNDENLEKSALDRRPPLWFFLVNLDFSRIVSGPGSYPTWAQNDEFYKSMTWGEHRKKTTMSATFAFTSNQDFIPALLLSLVVLQHTNCTWKKDYRRCRLVRASEQVD